MKLAIDKNNKGRIVTDAYAEEIKSICRIVDVIYEGSKYGVGKFYRDIWGGTWLLYTNGESICTVGNMDKWA